MIERPILFSGAMVRAILAGTKTQTRRVVKLVGAEVIEEAVTGPWPFSPQHDDWIACPFGRPGNRLWVRETFAPSTSADTGKAHAVYAASGHGLLPGQRWWPSIHMPRWASRLTLEVTGVRVERLQTISEEDAKAEGADRDFTPCDPDDREDPREVGYPSASDTAHAEATKHRRFFRSLWESINGPDSWAANPWVWVVDFRRVTP